MINRLKYLKKIPKGNLFNEYIINKQLYKSSRSNVYRVFEKNDRSSNTHYIIKELDKINNSDHTVLSEFINMQSIPENIGPKAFKITKNEKSYQLLLEYIDGIELFDYFKHFEHNSLNIPKTVIREIIFNCLLNLKKLNDKNFVHLDLKPENLILKGPNDNMVYPISFIDFGSSYKFSGNIVKNSRINGTFFYAAPETLHNTISKNSDIWSLGVITHVLLYHRYPYKSNITNTNYEILDSQDLDIKKSQKNNDLANDFIKQCLVFDYFYRPNAETLLDHPWFKKPY